MKQIKYFVLIAALFCNSNFAQFTDFHPELNWRTIETENKKVKVHFHDEAERTAYVAAQIMDDIWEPITSLYKYEPETIHFVIKDIDDYSNGITNFIDNKIEIWASAMDFDLRGTHNWLRNVITHEFTHMVQLQVAMKFGRTLPAFSVQFLNYEDKRRPDILYGFPNVLAVYPISGINVPSWFAEGTAQYQRKELQYEDWDSHRDMILRVAALENTMLSYNQMGVFGKTSLGNESVYNHGYALTRYISQKYGEIKLKELSESLSKFVNFTFDEAAKECIGLSGEALYNEWRYFLTEDYRARSAEVLNSVTKGELIAKDGFANAYPEFDFTGRKIVYISNKGMDYFSPSSVFVYDIEARKEKLIVSGVRSTVAWIPGEEKIIYAKLSEENENFANLHDLYMYDLASEKERRITYGLRANYPSISSDGRKIVFVFQKDGTSNLGVVDIDGTNFKVLTIFANGEQVYSPKFSPDCKKIIFDYSDFKERDIAVINSDGSGFEFLIKTENDERNPFFYNNEKIIYSSDETGIFNLYMMDLNDGDKKRITNVIGGAFMASASIAGDIAYAGYESTGYKIFYISKDSIMTVDDSKKYIRTNNPPLQIDNPAGDIDSFDIKKLKNFNDKIITRDYNKKRYSGEFSKFVFVPFIRYDNYNTSPELANRIKPGLAAMSSDMLNRYEVFAVASINKIWERDLYLSFDYRNKLPVLFNLGIKPQLTLELYSVSRKANTELLWGEYTVGDVVNYDYEIPVSVVYNLFEFDIAAKHRVFNRLNNIEIRYIYSKYTSTLNSFNLPDGQLYPTTNDVYLIGSNFQLLYTFDFNFPYIDADINPIGINAALQLNYEINRFNPEGNYEVVDGTLKPQYDNFDFPKVEANIKGGIPLFGAGVFSASLRGAAILGPVVPDFFDYYLGGLIGMKAYPFYAISGNELAHINLTYRFPLFKNIDSRFGHIYVDKIFVSAFGDIGNAWNGATMPAFKDFKKGAGAEIRMKFISYYIYPTSLFISAAYSFDIAEKKVRNDIIRYGKEWQFYGGLLFDFSF